MIQYVFVSRLHNWPVLHTMTRVEMEELIENLEQDKNRSMQRSSKYHTQKIKTEKARAAVGYVEQWKLNTQRDCL